MGVVEFRQRSNQTPASTLTSLVAAGALCVVLFLPPPWHPAGKPVRSGIDPDNLATRQRRVASGTRSHGTRRRATVTVDTRPHQFVLAEELQVGDIRVKHGLRVVRVGLFNDVDGAKVKVTFARGLGKVDMTRIYRRGQPIRIVTR